MPAQAAPPSRASPHTPSPRVFFPLAAGDTATGTYAAAAQPPREEHYENY